MPRGRAVEGHRLAWAEIGFPVVHCGLEPTTLKSAWVACAKRGQGDSQSGRWLDQLGHIGTEADDALETAQQTEL